MQKEFSGISMRKNFNVSLDFGWLKQMADSVCEKDKKRLLEMGFAMSKLSIFCAGNYIVAPGMLASSAGQGMREQLVSLCASASAVSKDTRERFSQLPWDAMHELISNINLGKFDQVALFLSALPQHDVALCEALKGVSQSRRSAPAKAGAHIVSEIAV